MKRVVFYSLSPEWPWLRQTDDGAGLCGNSLFSLHQDDGAEYLVVYDELPEKMLTRIPQERRILFIGEPPEVKYYPAAFLRQFGKIVSPYRLKNISPKQLQIQQSALPWHLGVNFFGKNAFQNSQTLTEFKAAPPPCKTKLLSVLCSNKTITTEHRLRLAFVERLKREFGDELDVFGRGFNEVGNKADAILPYKYHIVLENNSIENFWTEKLADAYLGYSFPLYSGGKKLHTYFSPESYERIDLKNFDSAISIIERVIRDDMYNDRLEHLAESRKRVLTDYNLFYVIDELIAGEDLAQVKPLVNPAVLKPSSQLIRFLARSVRSGIMGLYK